MKRYLPVLLACAMSQVHAQQNPPPVSSIRVTGEAVVTAKPERAQVDIGVMSQEKQSQNAATQTAKQMDSIQAALHKLLGADADIKTVNYSLTPDYQYRPIGIGSRSSVSTYTALNVVRVTVDDLDKVGALIDAATQAGANHIESVRYTVKDPQALHAEALKQAAVKARSSAEALAAALNLKIGRIVSVEEPADLGTAGPDPSDLAGPPGPAPAPAQSGSFAVTANVTLTVEVLGR